MMDRRKFLIGLVATGSATAVPWNSPQANELIKNIPTLHRNCLNDFINAWDKMSRHYDWRTMRDVGLIELTSMDRYQNDPLYETFPNLRYFTVEVDKIIVIDPNDQFIAVKCGFMDHKTFKKIWYIVRLDRKDYEIVEQEIQTQPSSNVAAVVEYLDNDQRQFKYGWSNFPNLHKKGLIQ